MLRDADGRREELVGIALMVAISVVTVLAAHGVAARAATAGAMALAELGLLLERHGRGRIRAVALLAAIAASLAAMAMARSGLAEVPVLVAASRLPRTLAGTALRIAVAVSAIAFGALVVVLTGSASGVLAAIGVWLLAQRTVTSAALEQERDRAVALLAELQASRAAEAEAAAGRERARIAGEMHDVLAHSLAGLSLQLQAVRSVAVAEGVGAAVTGPLDRAAELAREGVVEARAAVGALREPGAPGLDAVGPLVERFPGAAVLTVEGAPGQVPRAAGHAVFRAVQESLTNAARYAPGAPVEVALAWAPEHLVVTVSNDAPRRPAARDLPSTGAGLSGMADRVRSVGGSAESGPAGAGWRVRVCVPTGAA